MFGSLEPISRRLMPITYRLNQTGAAAISAPYSKLAEGFSPDPRPSPEPTRIARWPTALPLWTVDFVTVGELGWTGSSLRAPLGFGHGYSCGASGQSRPRLALLHR